jgi:hypothetical protein
LALPEYIEDRLRRAPPPGAPIVPGSTPVLAFGDPNQARVATLGLNPSRVEFLGRDGNELVGEKRRLPTLRSLGVARLTDAPSEVLEKVVDGCNGYFDRNPYTQWFDPLDQINEAGCGASYQDGSACHLDLVQWATDPTWRGLRPPSLRRALIEADRGFFLRQVNEEEVEILLLNGVSVVREFEKASQVSLLRTEDVTAGGYAKSKMFQGALGEVRVIGWSINLQSSPGVDDRFRRRLSERVRDALR